jgi:predicted metalloprotease
VKAALSRRIARVAAGAAALSLVLTACSATIDGTGKSALPPVAPDAQLDIVNTGNTDFDQLAANAIADVESFWKTTYPELSGGEALPELKGGIYSVDPDDITSAAKENACVEKAPQAIEDNAFYCTVDDSIAYSRTGFVPELAKTYGDFFVGMLFAHEFGHAVQHRLDIADPPKLIILETQADCFAGAFAGSVLALKAPHWRVSTSQLNEILTGYIQLRDPEGTSQEDEGSHGNGFDRLSAVADGIINGAGYCTQNWDDRQFSERPYTDETDYANNGNLPLDQVLDPQSAGFDGLQGDLNAYWAEAAKSIGKSFTDVQFQVVDSIPCGKSDDASEFSYCPNDNTVYITQDVAQKAYGAGDFALGTVISYGWGMAVRHQLFNRELGSRDALLAAGCYTGAYAKDINVEDPPREFQLSPPDMDEATVATLSMVGSSLTFGSRDTTGLDRIAAFNKGYFNGLSAC